MRKTCFLHLCKNKGADQLGGNRAADQHPCFHYIESTIPQLPKSEISVAVSYLVRNPEDRFSHDAAHLYLFSSSSDSQWSSVASHMGISRVWSGDRHMFPRQNCRYLGGDDRRDEGGRQKQTLDKADKSC